MRLSLKNKNTVDTKYFGKKVQQQKKSKSKEYVLRKILIFSILTLKIKTRNQEYFFV